MVRAYGSPILAEIGGTRQLMLFSQKNFIGVNPANGELLWSVPSEARSTTTFTTLKVRRQHHHRVGSGEALTAYIVANKGGKWVADLAWENPQLSMSFSNAVLIGDAVFSMSPLNSALLLGRCEDRQDALGIGAASGRERRHHPVGRSALRPQRRWDADDRKATPGAAFVPVKTYTVAMSAMRAPPVIFGKSDFREGCGYALVVDAELRDVSGTQRRTREGTETFDRSLCSPAFSDPGS